VNTLNIDLRDLDPGRQQRSFAPTADALDLDPEVFSDIAVTADVTVAREVLVTLDVTATARLVCSRTLVEFDEPLSGTLTLLAIEEDPADGIRGDAEVDVAGEQPDTVGIAGGIINLATPARDLLLLSVPFRPVAPEARDIEIQTSWGPDDDDDLADPRWAALRGL
jgi:uncharacterized protein